MDNEKNQKEPKAPQPKMRQIIIETDGSMAKVIKADVAGRFELKSILQELLETVK